LQASDRRTDVWPELETMYDVQGMKADAAKAAKEAMSAFGDSAFDHMLPMLNGLDVYIDGSAGGRYVGVLKIVDGKVYVATDKGNVEASAWGALCSVQSAFTAPRDLIKLIANGMSIAQALHAMGGRTTWNTDNYATEEIFTKGLGCSNVQRSKGWSLEEFAKVSLPTLGTLDSKTHALASTRNLHPKACTSAWKRLGAHARSHTA
jgi:hypothetical protein